VRRSKLASVVADLVAAHERPRYLHVVADLATHDRRAVVDGTRCPCCGSPHAEIVATDRVADLVIDRRTGARIAAADRSPAEWTELCSLAERHQITLRCSVRTRPLLLDASRTHRILSGGNRASKTTTALTAFALDVLRHGGRERRAWLVASTDQKAYRLLEKLFRGTGESPAILPNLLVERMPESHRASNLVTRLVDGTLVDLRGFTNDPGAERVKSDAIFVAVVDEAAHVPSADTIAALRGRCVDAGGRLWLATTPRPSSPLTTVVEDALACARLPHDAPERASHPGSAWSFEAIAIRDNPFLPADEVERYLSSLDLSKPENRRDALGEWISSEGLCWTDFDADRHVVAHEARDVARLSGIFLASVAAPGHVAITGDVVDRLFGRTNPHSRTVRATNKRYVLGVDVNVNPMSTVLVQVTAPPDRVADPDAWHYWIVDEVISPTSNSLRHAERLVSAELARALDATGTGSPLAGCGVIADATAISRDPTQTGSRAGAGSLAETFARVGLDLRAPAYRTNTAGRRVHSNPDRRSSFALLHRLLTEGRLHVFSRCTALLNAFATQLVEPDGICALDARRGHWDKVMGPIDALRYIIYAIANAPPRAAVVARPLFG
jgi:hypothetical protein